MPHSKYIVFTEPKAGQDDAYNDWYDNIHLAEVIAVEGFVAAQRFKIVDVTGNAPGASRYLAIYEIEAADPRAVIDRLMAIGTGGGMHRAAWYFRRRAGRRPERADHPVPGDRGADGEGVKVSPDRTLHLKCFPS